MKLYVVFSDYTEQLSRCLAEKYQLTIAGQDRTLEAAIAAAPTLKAHPDVFLVLGKALASTVVDGRLDSGAALILNLTQLRNTYPKSRTIVVLAGDAPKTLIREITNLGIYDILCKDNVTVDELVQLINEPKTFADAHVELDAKPHGNISEVTFEDPNAEAKSRFPVLESLWTKLQQGKESLQVKFRKPAQQGVRYEPYIEETKPQGSNETPSVVGAEVELPAVITRDGLVSVVDPRDTESEGVLIPASWGIEEVKALRRDLTLTAIVVIGSQNEDFLDAGADRCAERVTPEIINEARRLTQRMRELWDRAQTDPLTGCYTRAFWDAWFADHAHHAAVAVLDLDHFKSVNDAHGHAAGDAVLKAFGSFLRANVRGGDVVVRHGGKEFVVGMPYTSTEGAQAFIERLREAWSLQEVVLPNGERVACTFSAGVASGSAALDRADRALYRAKADGRDNVQAAEPEAAPQPRPDVVRVRSKIVTVLSPWIPDCPVAEAAVGTAERLAGDGLVVGLVDAAVKAPGVSRLLGIPDADVWEYDWRLGGVEAGIRSGNLFVWPLDPLRPGPADEGAFLRLVEAASAMVDRLIISGGSDPDLVAGHALVLVAPCPDFPEIVRAWNYFRPVRDGSLVIVGNVDPSGFGLPVAAVLSRLSGEGLAAVFSTEIGYAHTR